MSERYALVTGAAGGKQGRTGWHVAKLLLRQGCRVRAFVRKSDERSEYLKNLGAEVFVGDLLDFQSVRRASAEVFAIYFAYPVQDGLLEATANMAVAARDAGVGRLVNLVMLSSSPDAPTLRMRQNYLSEQIMDWAGIGAVHLRAAVFYENLHALVSATVAAAGVIRLPWGSGDTTTIPLVSAEDVAHVAARLLLDPDIPSGSIYPMVGAVPTLGEIVATFSRVLAKDIRYESLSDDAWRQLALEHGVNHHAVEHLSHLWRYVQLASAPASPVRVQVTTDTFERFVGADPLTLEDFLTTRRNELAPARPGA